MPRRDGTGPQGLGMMTGRQMGYCRSNRPNDAYGFGYGYGRGLGFRRGLGAGRFFPSTSLDDEKQILEDRLNQINRELSDREEK